MTPIQREIIDNGLMVVIEAAQALVRQTRLVFGTNDIVVVAFTQADGFTRLHGKTRKRTLELLEGVLPEAHDTIARVKEGPLPVNRFLIMIVHKGTTYVLDWPTAEGTEGVIN